MGGTAPRIRWWTRSSVKTFLGLREHMFDKTALGNRYVHFVCGVAECYTIPCLLHTRKMGNGTFVRWTGGTEVPEVEL